jgi:hypothetical protein
VRNLSYHSHKIKVDYNLDVRDTYLNLARSVAFGIVDIDGFSSLFVGSDANTSWDPDYKEAYIMFCIASCKKKENVENSDWEMESWLPDWTVKTRFDSTQHRQAVELCVRESLTFENTPEYRHELIVTRTGYSYLAIEGTVVDPWLWSSNEMMHFEHSDVYLRESLRPWVEEVFDVVTSHRQSQGAELDLIWFPMSIWTFSVAFILRPIQNHRTFRQMPVYRLQSCVLISAQHSDGKDGTGSWRRWVHATTFFSQLKFCLE